MTAVPIIFSTPWSPNVVVLTVLGSSFSVITIPLLIVGLIYLTSSKKLMIAKYRNKWWQTLLLGIIGIVGIWSSFKLVESLLSALTTS